ncbi:hypothetical protein HPP92_010387 [Vanilla planifolia]|uniref:Uncharacterized protein n=1 Tax=Vanilla planifolia TaxID=51239 RepID=A0A835UXH3_VANPL|nr:hypothetical protein HPP92_010387 [Vanilla planifolia]
MRLVKTINKCFRGKHSRIEGTPMSCTHTLKTSEIDTKGFAELTTSPTTAIPTEVAMTEIPDLQDAAGEESRGESDGGMPALSSVR